MSMRRLILGLALFVPGAAGAQPSQPGPNAPITATGGTVARTAAAMAADRLNILSYIQAADTDATAGLGRAATAAISKGNPARIYLPCGTYVLSGTISISTAASQGVDIQGESAACVTVRQTADADAISVSLTNYGGVFGTGAIRVSGIKFQMAAASSTTRKAISISSTAASGAAGVPMVLDDLNFASASSTSYWGDEIYLSQIPDAVYVSRINGYMPGQSTGGVHLSVNGTSTGYTTSVFIRDVFFVGGLRGLELGDYLQGIHISNANTVGTAYALVHTPVNGINVEIQVSNSYLDGKTLISNANGGSVGELSFSHTVFDALNGVASGETNVAITGVTTLTMTGNTFTGSSSVTNIRGLTIAGSNVTPASLIGNKFTGYANGGTAISLSNTTYPMTLIGNMFSGNATDVIETGVANSWVNNTFSNANYTAGHSAKDGLQFSGSGGLVNLLAQGVDANVAYLFAAKGLPGSDYYFRDGLSRDLLQLKDSQSGTTSAGVSLTAGNGTYSPSIAPQAGNLLLGGSAARTGTAGLLATTATSGHVQIPYMAGTPTGTPSTPGGASVVYNTTSHNLNIYDPVAGSWYHVALTAGGG